MKAAAILTVTLLAQAALAQQQTVAITAESSNAAGNPRIFLGQRDPQTGQGDAVAARAADTSGTAPAWSAAAMLDAQSVSTRTLFTADTSGTAFALDWSRLTPAQRALLASHALGEADIGYLRGDRRDEGTASGMRVRASRLGEVVNSNLWLARTPASASASGAAQVTLFAGTGDGMLHGFDATTGAETLAYVPRGLLPRLATRIRGRDPMPHAVDGPVFAAAVPVGVDNAISTLLVGALGAGGKGYFVLDVSALASAAGSLGYGLVRVDTTASSDPDIGHIYTPPVVDSAQAHRTRQIVRLNDQRWAAVMGNGYFSTRGRPVLLVQYLDGARELIKLSPCQDGQPCAYEGGNGLSAPQLIDLNGDGKVDIAYAGDLHGHVWKFDLSDDPASGGAWRIGFSGAPFFTAQAPDGQRQPITTAPHWMAHPRGGLMVVIGTGRHLNAGDTADAGVHSIYGLHDNSAIAAGPTRVSITDGSPIPSTAAHGRAAVLVQQRYATGQADAGTTYYDASREVVMLHGPQPHRGWWIDLPHPGQRVLQNPRSFEGQKLLVHSVRPMPDASAPASAARLWTMGDSYVSVLNMLTGHPPAQPAFSPQDATHAATSIGMASVPGGPSLQSRILPDAQQLRFPGAQQITLRNGRTVGASAGWRDR